jgi:hypothetical protein
MSGFEESSLEGPSGIDSLADWATSDRSETAGVAESVELRRETPNEPLPERQRRPRLPPDYQKFKAALLSQPAELIVQLGEPALRPGDVEQGGWRQFLRARRTPRLWPFVALACGLSLASIIAALLSGFDAAATPDGAASPARIGGPSVVRGAVALPAAMIDRASLAPALVHAKHARAARDQGGREQATAAVSRLIAPGAHLPPTVVQTKVEPVHDQVEPAGPSAGNAYAPAPELATARDSEAVERRHPRALERGGGSAAAYELGHLLQRQGRYVEAAESYELAAQLAPDRAYILYDLGNVLAKQQRLEAAAARFERAAALDATNPFIWYDWGWTLEQAGKVSMALDKYRSALAVGPGTVAGKNADARLRQLTSAQ